MICMTESSIAFFCCISINTFILQSPKYNFYSNSKRNDFQFKKIGTTNSVLLKILPFKKHLFHRIPNSNTNSVTNQVAPQETEAKYQPSQGIGAQGINPGCMIQLAYFDTVRKYQGDNGYPNCAFSMKNEAKQQKHHQCPQRITQV
jgi:hypothetical protein